MMMVHFFVHAEGIREKEISSGWGKKKTKQETHSDNKGVRHWKKLLEDSVEFEAVDICRKAYDRNC